MIIDSLENAPRYYNVHPHFTKAFEWLKSQDLLAIDPRKYPIDDNLNASVSEKQGNSEEDAKFECHQDWIDIQVCISERERMGWSSRNSCAEPQGEYNPEKDVLFFDDKPGMYFELQAGQFAVFFPEDVHAPMIGGGTIKKLVIKVRR